MTGSSSFIKIQINFLEKIIFPIKARELIPLINEKSFSKEDMIYYGDFLTFYGKINIQAYSIEEIVAEKVRSLLTRKAIKSRDAIDLLFISKKFNIDPQDLLKEAKEKLLFSIVAYEKYKDNLLVTKDKLQTMDFNYNEVRQLVIKPFNKEDFDDFIIRLKPLLINLAEDLSKSPEVLGK
jgi:predicted nucleotidyltransferase component of viral defense system